MLNPAALARALVAALVLCLPAACTVDDSGRPRDAGPNILIVVTDDQRADSMATMSDTTAWFGRGGTTFTTAFATTPQCCPSRASILTGRYAHNHGVQTNFDANRLDEDTTIQAHLQRAGYRTAIVGKYLNRIGSYSNRANASIDPAHFDDWATFLGGYNDTLFNVGGDLRSVSRYSTDFISAHATRLLKRFETDDERRWFLYVAPFAPHAPYEPSPRYARAATPPYDVSPSVGATGRRQPPFLPRYDVSPEDARRASRKRLRLLMSVDDLVAALARALEDLDESRDTLAVFTSDNGMQWGEKGLLGKGPFPYEESVHVPLMIRWPGHVAAGAEDDRLAGNVDIAPTLLDAARIGPDAAGAVDGRSLLDESSRRHLLLEYGGRGRAGVPSWAALRTLSELYVEHYRNRSGDVLFKELYDLDEDPHELVNLAGREAARRRLRALAARLRSVRTCSGARCP